MCSLRLIVSSCSRVYRCLPPSVMGVGTSPSRRIWFSCRSEMRRCSAVSASVKYSRSVEFACIRSTMVRRARNSSLTSLKPGTVFASNETSLIRSEIGGEGLKNVRTDAVARSITDALQTPLSRLELSTTYKTLPDPCRVSPKTYFCHCFCDIGCCGTL